jgi:hypothetical protein
MGNGADRFEQHVSEARENEKFPEIFRSVHSIFICNESQMDNDKDSFKIASLACQRIYEINRQGSIT